MTLAGIVPCIVVAVFVGAALQRLSGTGVGLVVSPVLTLLLGPQLGVFLTNSATVVSGFLIMLAVFREVDWKRYFIILPTALIGAVPAAKMVKAMPAGWLNVVIGAVVVIGLIVTFSMPRVPRLKSSALTGAAGIVGGFLNTAAGVAAPAMVVYSKLSGWPQRSFAATMQPTFMTMGVFSVTVKLLAGTTVVTELPPWWVFLIIIATVLLGMWAGGALARFVTMPAARSLAVALAGLGGIVTIIRGIVLMT